MEMYRVHRDGAIKKPVLNILVVLLNNIDCASHYITGKMKDL